ncbi:hypothetical protein FNH22_30030 [Fulvivirga sp. M361]|uniref:hypothetical protein n=1 Tax=Fulvivirga sp. M361 TaxID=2594266 RepID=UPI00117BA111|nr:hypothetical protein [Fulvivirga sp. M361]TRX47314.1 hypothetical protein FNH22_30030 [Fulvivirga sp. M361]
MKNFFLLTLLCVGLASCDISDNDVDPTQSFLKIYDNNTFNSSFVPVDIQQTADGGYLVLGSTRIEDSDFTGVYVMKVDENGEFLSEQNLSTQYISPAKSLMSINGSFYFAAMRDISYQALLFELDDNGNLTDSIELNVTRPMFASNVNNEIILQSYNHGDRNTEISTIALADPIIISEPTKFAIGDGDGIDLPIFEHFTRTGRKLPFFTGKTETGLYFFNGFYRFTISMVFTNLISDNDPTGVLQGQREDDGVSTAIHLTGNRFAVSRFNRFGDTYILPNADIDIANKIGIANDLVGNPFPELVPDARLVLKRITVNERLVLIYGGDTRSGQIILMAYSPDTGELLGTKYLGFSNPYELASFNATEDGGLVVLGSTAIAGRFDRFSIFKLSSAELQEFTN